MTIQFIRGPLDGLGLDLHDFKDPPGTEILDKKSGQLYRYCLTLSTKTTAAYTHSPQEGSNCTDVCVACGKETTYKITEDQPCPKCDWTNIF